MDQSVIVPSETIAKKARNPKTIRFLSTLINFDFFGNSIGSSLASSGNKYLNNQRETRIPMEEYKIKCSEGGMFLAIITAPNQEAKKPPMLQVPCMEPIIWPL